MAGADFTRVTLQNPANDTWRFALGAHYQLNSKILVMGAFGFDESANDNTSPRAISDISIIASMMFLGVKN